MRLSANYMVTEIREICRRNTGLGKEEKKEGGNKTTSRKERYVIGHRRMMIGNVGNVAFNILDC